MKKIANEPAFVLHRYDWSESSLILEVFTRHHGRIALVAKGAKRPSSQFRPILLPLQPLHIAFGGDAEVGTLKGAEWMGGLTMPTGDALLSGYYINELVMRLLARDDPHEQLFDAYATVTQLLRSPELLESALRAFELLVLREIGLLPSLDVASLTLQPLQAHVQYTLMPEAGLRTAHAADDPDPPHRQPAASLSAYHWRALHAALHDAAPLHAVRSVCTAMGAADKTALKTQLRSLLHYHSGGKTLRTRQMMMDLQAL
jgi:DNA repair protein RecO (recombination protein O)